MTNQEHVKWLREGVEAWNKRRGRTRFTPLLAGANLRSVNLSGAYLSGAYMGGADLLGADLSDAHLTFVDLSETILVSANLSGANLASADLSGANLINANLSRANLRGADLSGAWLTQTEPWKAKLYITAKDSGTIQGTTDAAGDDERKKIKSIGSLLLECRDLRDRYRDDILFYFRGDSRTSRELRPSVMRPSPAGEFPFRGCEGEMLLDLMSRQPEAFGGLTLAIDQWVLAQHHGLKTRLLDITRNPLVAMFNVCKKHDMQRGSDREDGCLHVFAVPREMVKPFNSDTISIVANYSKLRRSEQTHLLGKDSLDPQDKSAFTRYDRVLSRLYNFIRHEKPSFQEKIDPRDLFRVFVVEPQWSFQRLRAQSGAFLLSAFHERFERDEILKWNTEIPVYDHYTLTVSGERKGYIMDELRLLNITHESLFPGLDEAAKAVIQRYSNERSTNSED